MQNTFDVSACHVSPALPGSGSSHCGLWFLTLLIVVLIGMALGVGGMVFTIAVLQAAMAPMISAGILAAQNDLEPELANTVLGAGILLSFLTVPLVDQWLRL